ncbi:hypothetical protein LINPERHAP2_LOCUS5567 [Linum perenne]
MEAALSYDEPAKRIRGDKARINIPTAADSRASFSPPPAKKRCFSIAFAQEETAPPTPASPLPFDGFRFISNTENAVPSCTYELKKKISSLKSFLELDPEAVMPPAVSDGDAAADLWMLDDLVNQN